MFKHVDELLTAKIQELHSVPTNVNPGALGRSIEDDETLLITPTQCKSLWSPKQGGIVYCDQYTEPASRDWHLQRQLSEKMSVNPASIESMHGAMSSHFQNGRRNDVLSQTHKSANTTHPETRTTQPSKVRAQASNDHRSWMSLQAR